MRDTKTIFFFVKRKQH